MRGRATESGSSMQVELRAVSHFMKTPTAVASLRAQHGEANARMIALTEQRRARRARSKKRFVFWADVASQTGNGNFNNAANIQPVDREGLASRL
jgi:hypothetical protein